MTVARATRSTRPHSFAEISVSEAMHPGILTCAVETPLRDVARIMATYRVHCVVVYGEEDDRGGGRLWGVVSDLDLASAATFGDLEIRTAGATAVTPVIMVSPTDSLEHAAQLMREHEVAHVIVVDEQTARPVGVLSTLDLARQLALGT